VKVLFLAPYVPYPIVHGGRNWTAGLVRALARFATVRVLAAGDPRASEVVESKARLEALGVTLDVFAPTGPGAAEADPDDIERPPDALAHFRCPGLLKALPPILGEFTPDVVHFEELVMAQYAGAISGPRVSSRQKVEWAYLEASRHAGIDADMREAARFHRFEGEAARHFDRVLVVGEEDRQSLGPIYGRERVELIPIPVDDAIRMPSDRTREIRHVLLYGTVDYAPNIEANDRYLREVWPPLSRALPDLRTLVVGSGTPPPSLCATHPRVEVRGFVPDIASLLAGAGVLVVPLRVGGGARTKILEAMAAGMPVVSTAVGVENLGLEAGRHYLLAETPAEAVDAVSWLAREPELVARLGRAGAAWIDRFHRLDVIAPILERIYESVASAPGRDASKASTTESGTASKGGVRRVSNATRRALLIGCGPLPDAPDALDLSFAGHRTGQFTAALEMAGYVVEGELLTEANRFRPRPDLQRLHDSLAPDVIVSAGGYHPARIAVQLDSDRPRFIDLAGDLAAEAQLRAAQAGDGVLAEYLSVLARALAVGDRFSVVGPTQRLVVLGQLGAAGRFTGSTVGQDPVAVVPLAAEGPSIEPPLPAQGFRVLWSGSYNTWMDPDTLFDGLEAVMARRPEVVFVSTGGPVADHDEDTFGRFWSRARRSAFANRFEDRGRVSRREAVETLGGCHVGLSVSRDCFEAQFGSRQRLVEGLAYGRPAITTALGDLSAAIAVGEAGIVVPPGDPAALAAAIGALADDRSRLAAFSGNARRLWEQRFRYRETTAPLQDWLRDPRRWPPGALGQDGIRALATDRLRLAAELDAIRGSYTFRALRMLDRLLGRAPGRPR
jgi:polysaccharide biosynthesis protein PslH